MSLFAKGSGWRPGLMIAGFVGGMLTLYPPAPRFMVESVPNLHGLWFGLALGGYFLLFDRHGSAAKALGIMVVSAAAFWLAFMTTFGFELSYNHSGGESPSVHAVPLFIGGCVGAFVMSTTTFFLYGESRESMRQKIFACSIAGGFLGAAGYGLGRAMQSGFPSEAFSNSVLFVVWQTGLGLLMGVVWPGPHALGTAHAAPLGMDAAESPAPSKRASRPVPLLAKVFMIAVVIPMVWATIGGVRTQYRMRQGDAALQAYHAGRPTLEGLQPIAARSDDQVMILTSIADRTAHSLGYHVMRADGDQPQKAEYTVCYMNRPSEQCGATPPAVDVRVTQYPTPEWALYALRGTSAVAGSTGGLGREEVVMKFGQRILQPPSVSPGTGDVYWASDVYVVRVMSYIPDADPFIRAYLDRHRSSL